MRRVALSVVLCLLVSVPAYAASFDCNKAASKVEVMICSDAELSKLDEEMSAAYKFALKDVTHVETITQAQSEWVKERSACSTTACAKRAYEKQLSLLKLPIITVPTGKPIAYRINHTATLLPDGKVLIAGGGSGVSLKSAELYDPATGTFTATGNLVEGRRQHSAMLLPNGKVILVRGYPSDDGPRHFVALSSAELYDPGSGTFNTTQDFPVIPQSLVLANGTIFYAGINRAQIYDPETGRTTVTRDLVIPRGYYTTTLLQNGTVLIAGGYGSTREEYTDYLAKSERYDPVTNRFTVTGKLSESRSAHTATLLQNGKVLVAGGFFKDTSLASANLYDPATGRFSATGKLVYARYSHKAILLKNGKVLIAGGAGSDGSFLASIELYDPTTGTFSIAGRYTAGCFECTVTLLQDGKVLFVAGDTAELYNPPK